MREQSRTDTDWESWVLEKGLWLTRCAYLLTGDRETALDLSQDTLVRAWTARERVEAATNRDAYVLRIMMNIFRDSRRRSSRKPLATLAQTDEIPSEFDHARATSDSDLVMRALQALSERQRTVIALRYWADLDDVEIADVLQCRRATVRSLGARGVRAMRTYMEETDGQA